MTSTQNQQAKLFWSNHIDQWRSSGLSQAAYCRQHDLCQQKFSYRKRQSVCCEENTDTSTGFARVQVAPSIPFAEGIGLSLRFNDGISLEGITESNLDLLQRLLTVLR